MERSTALAGIGQRHPGTELALWSRVHSYLQLTAPLAALTRNPWRWLLSQSDVPAGPELASASILVFPRQRATPSSQELSNV